MSEVTITTGSLSQAQKEVVQKQVMFALKDLTRNVLFKYAEKVNFEPKSDTYTWRKYALKSKTSSHLIEGVTPEGLEYGLTDYSVKVYQEGNFIPLTDKMLKYGIDQQLAIASELLGEDAEERMAGLLSAIVFGGTNVRYAQGQASRAAVLSGTKGITIADLNKIKADMRRRKVKSINGKYIFVASPEILGDIKNLEGVNKSWIDVEKYGDQSDIIDGEVGTFLGFRFVEFLDVPVYDTYIHGCLVFGEGAFGTVAIDGEDAAGGFDVIYHAPGESGANDPLNQRGSIGWKHNGFNGRILRDEALLRYEVYHDEAVVSSEMTDSSRTHYNSASGNIVPTLTAGTNMSIKVTGNVAPGNLIKLEAVAASGYHLASTVWTTASFAGVDLIQGTAGDSAIFVQVKKNASAVTIVAANAVSDQSQDYTMIKKVFWGCTLKQPLLKERR